MEAEKGRALSEFMANERTVVFVRVDGKKGDSSARVTVSLTTHCEHVACESSSTLDNVPKRRDEHHECNGTTPGW